MNILHIVLLFALSGIWGGSFIFMRHLAPIFGAVITADLRLLIAGAFLLGLLTLMGTKPEWRKHWKQYLIAGAVNSGAPALLYSFAALHIPASISVIINSMAPIFVVMFSIIWLGEKLSIVKVAGLLLGTGGVALVASVGAVSGSAMSILAILACVGAACCYGLAGVYIKKYSSHIKPRLMAMGSQALVGAILFPLIFAFPPAQDSNCKLGAYSGRICRALQRDSLSDLLLSGLKGWSYQDSHGNISHARFWNALEQSVSG